jgi:hypothetical protein
MEQLNDEQKEELGITLRQLADYSMKDAPEWMLQALELKCARICGITQREFQGHMRAISGASAEQMPEGMEAY